MRPLHDVAIEVNISHTEIEAWIREEWLRPAQDNGIYLFDEADVARCRLIGELRSDLLVGDEAIPVILSLLDQIYALRRALADIQDAVHQSSPEVREAIASSLRRPPKA